MTDSSAALSIRGLSKRFGATQALRDLDLDVAPGEVHAILGGNGSGKSTTVKILAGVYKADSGSVTIQGTTWDARQFNPSAARGVGLRFLHQDLGLFPDMTVAENLGFGGALATPGLLPLKRTALEGYATALLNRLELATSPRERLGDLRPSEQAMIAIARLLGARDDHPTVLVLDEPTAALPGPDADLLLAELRRQASRGMTIVYISHRLAEIRTVADSVTVLRDGHRVTSAPAKTFSTAGLVDAIVGVEGHRSHKTAAPPRAVLERAAPLLSVTGLRTPSLRRLDLDVARGEIVGITGLAGSGFEEALGALFGFVAASAGSVRLDGRDYAPSDPSEALAQGVVYAPADRNRDGSFPDLPIRVNLTAPRVRDYWRRGWLSLRREKRQVEDEIRKFGVKSAGPEAELGALSGGNQQKVVMARCLALAPRLLLLAEPTQGVDVGARAEIYAHIRALVAEGMSSVLVASTDADELVQLCDRVLVLSDAVAVAELAGEDLNIAQMSRVLHHTPVLTH